MNRKLSYKIPAEYDECKVIHFLRGEIKMSARLIKTLKGVEDGLTLNGEHTRTVDILHVGDILGISIPCPDSATEPIEMHLDILFEDDDIIILNKNPFLACHPTHNHQGDTLANGIAYHLNNEGKACVFRAVGRLDKGTSGIVICALNKYSAAKLQRNFKKEYIAIASGKLAETGTIDKPIYRPDPMKTLRAVGEDGDRAVTHWTLEKGNDEMSLIRIKLETGRTHQIRVHFASIGHPLIGDSMYGTDDYKIGHQLLHCAKVTLRHPVTDEIISVEAPMPDDMQAYSDRI